MKPPTLEELIDVVRRYYPVGRTPYDHNHEASPEWHRFMDLWHGFIDDRSRWLALDDLLTREFSGITVGDATAYTHDGGCRCCVYAIEPESTEEGISKEVLGCVSLLAPVYYVYGTQDRILKRKRIEVTVFLDTLPEELAPYAAKVARGIETVFTGYTPFPKEWLHVPLPDLCADGIYFGKWTLFNLLFTLQPDNFP